VKDRVIVFILSLALLAVLFQNYSANRPTIQTSSLKRCIPKENVESIRFDCTLEQAKYQMIAKDLGHLRSFHLSGRTSAELKRLLGLRDTSGPSLLGWLQERIRYILSEDFDSLPEDKKIIGLNYGSFRVIHSRDSRTLLPKLLIPGHGFVEVNSHWSGIVQLSSAFFGSSFDNVQGLERAKTIQRLGILFHEARHSEGSRDNPGLPHVRCPSGKGIPGEWACDQGYSGAYGVESLFLKGAIESCSTCTNAEINFLWDILSETRKHIF